MKLIFAVVLATFALTACTERQGAPTKAADRHPPAETNPEDSTKYASCAGSYELDKCRARINETKAETQEARQARIEKLERERLSAMQEVVKSPTPQAQTAQNQIAREPTVGMSEHDANLSAWGPPQQINRTVTTYGTNEQWVYGTGRYLYLVNGRVTAISTTH